MVAGQNAKLALSTLSRYLVLQRPRLYPRLASQCRCRRSVSSKPPRAHLKPTRGAQEAASRKRRLADSILDLTSLPPSVVESLIRDRSDDFNLLSPAEYYESLAAFTLHVRDHDSPFQLFSPTKKLPGVAVLHDLGCIVMEVSRGGRSGLASALWFTAGNWGYAPSTCSLIAVMARAGRYGQDAAMAPAEKRFRALVQSGDPVAVAIEGQILYQQGKYAEAEAALRQVLRTHAGTGGSAAFAHWEPNARLALGMTLGRRGRTDEAVAMLRQLSDDGYIEAEPVLGRLLRGSDPEAALQHLFKAGCTGALECFEEMAAIELDRAAKTDNANDAADHRLWAEELARLADNRAEF